MASSSALPFPRGSAYTYFSPCHLGLRVSISLHCLPCCLDFEDEGHHGKLEKGESVSQKAREGEQVAACSPLLVCLVPCVVVMFSGSWVLVLGASGCRPASVSPCPLWLCHASALARFYLLTCAVSSWCSVFLSSCEGSALGLRLRLLLSSFHTLPVFLCAFGCCFLLLLSLFTSVLCPFLSLFSRLTPLAELVGLSSLSFLCPQPHGHVASRGSKHCFPRSGTGVEAVMPARHHPRHHSLQLIPSDGATCHHRTVSTAPRCLPHR